MHKSQFIDPTIQKYVDEHSLRLNKAQRQLLDYSLSLPNSMMVGSIEVAQHFQVLLKSMNAKRIIEIGSFTGYTAMTMAMALPDDGFVVACDITDKYIAKNIWKEAGVAHKIKLIVGPALNSLNELIKQGYTGTFDFAFIDADKENNRNYYEMCLILVRKGGLIAIDNVLWSGAVARNLQDSCTRSICELNQFVRTDNRVDISMLPIGDGVTFCYKK